MGLLNYMINPLFLNSEDVYIFPLFIVILGVVSLNTYMIVLYASFLKMNLKTFRMKCQVNGHLSYIF